MTEQAAKHFGDRSQSYRGGKVPGVWHSDGLHAGVTVPTFTFKNTWRSNSRRSPALLKMFPRPSFLSPCRRSVSITCITAIYGFPRFTLFPTTRPNAGWNVNKPTPRCYTHTHTHTHTHSYTHTHTHTHTATHTHTDLYAEFDRVSISGRVQLLCKSTAPPLEPFLGCKIKALDACTSPQRFVSSLYYKVCVSV